eukprot:TRINITY_DN22674_c0_g1_i1.p1 TRINITY_DN22674_c0_g1~~TRINITY_DN22674_c0_g1_i1.p1  ORF type:complete len:364 (+),score=93.89 TRINITY_DN22674_c0_g1_i1:62-1153(+)
MCIRDRIMESAEGVLLDARGRRVNKYGYLVDEKGNIVNQEGKFVMTKEEFEKELEDEDVQPPQLPANNLFREITPNQQSFGAGDSDRDKMNTGQQIDCGEIESEARKSASLDSLMEDTPSNYNLQNQRYADPLVAAQKKGAFINKLPQYATRGVELTLNESREKRQQSNKSATKAANERIFSDVNRKHSFDIAMEEPNATRVKFNNIEAIAEAQGKPRTARNKFRRTNLEMRRAKSRKKEDELDKAYNLNVKAMAEEDCVSVVSAAPSAISRISNNDAKLRGLESIYLQRLESSSKHNRKIEEQGKRKRKVKNHKTEKGNQENGLVHDEISSLLADNYKTMELNFSKAPTDHMQTVGRADKKL